ncbi:origin recognition complex subunit 3 [Wolffia australiana]
MTPTLGTSNPPSPRDAEGITDGDLQPFFVLHKPELCKVDAGGSKRGKARRKIDLHQLSPNSRETAGASPSDAANDPDYGELRMASFNATWSEIECTIQRCMEKMNLELFEEVRGWTFESFDKIISSGLHSVSNTLSPCPLITDGTCRQIFTALILTKNMEHVDDTSTFLDLGEHLVSNGCHVANLSSSSFNAKHGVGGCLKSLLRQLVMGSSETFGMDVLASWYSKKENNGKPVVLIIDNIEQCCGTILAAFISIVSEWVIKIPIILFLGIATTTDALRCQLSSDSLKRLNCFRFSLPSPSERMNAIVGGLFAKPNLSFAVGHDVAVFLRNYFSRHDGTITSFVRALKIACAKHYSVEPLSFLSRFMHIGETEVTFDLESTTPGVSLPDSKLKLAFDLPSCRRGLSKEKSYSEFVQRLIELKKLWRDWSCVLMCLFEVGKISKMQLLDIFCEASAPMAPDSRNSSVGTMPPAKGKLISQAIQKVREISPAVLSCLLDTWAIHTAEIPENLDKVRELQSLLRAVDDDDCSKNQPTKISRRAGGGFYAEIKGNVQVNEKAALFLKQMIREMLKPIESIPFHEIFVFKRVDVLKAVLTGDSRKTIHLDLVRSPSFLRCHSCPSGGKALTRCMHDTTILYQLAQEHGDFVNLHNWYRSFSTILTASPAAAASTPRRKPKAAVPPPSPDVDTASIQARFCRAVIELQVAGLLRMPTKRRPDHVQRLVLGLSS